MPVGPSGTKVYKPTQALYTKSSTGISDSLNSSGVMKFLNSSVVSTNMTLGFNGISSSMTVTLAEDLANGDSFLEPTMPSLWAFSLPSGGVGTQVVYPTGVNLNPNSFYPTNVPFYFCGICTNYSKNILDTGAKTISVSLVDPREVLNGIQLLLNGYALSQAVGVGGYTDVNNIIDCFGYWNYGVESDRNAYGIPWYKIKQAIEAVRVTVHEINFEFYFQGDCFTNTPNYYRISQETSDIISLCTQVAKDGGSDFCCIARKVDSTTAVIEIRGIRRINNDPVTKTQIQDFINARSDIVATAKVGREYKNETTSNVIIGGFRNSNYIAQPSQYNPNLKLTSSGTYDYNLFPSDIKVRLFGGSGLMTSAAPDGSPVTSGYQTFDIDSGAIYPFWGFTPDDYSCPLIEPFISLHHLVFDKNSSTYAGLQNKIPLCTLAIDNFTVREVEHDDMFFDGDGDSDDRPFAYLRGYELNTDEADGKVRGLPLNTEVLRAALVGESCFWSIYGLYYPDIADVLGCPSPNWKQLLDWSGGSIDLVSFPIQNILNHLPEISEQQAEVSRDSLGRITKSDLGSIFNATNDVIKTQSILTLFRSIIFNQIEQYTKDHLGKRFIVCLPKSDIMQRIWQGLPVPTNPLNPKIEYNIDQTGYWNNVPPDLSNLVYPSGTGSSFTSDEIDQIRRKFMVEDGRFLPMVAIDFQPSGNINFMSNGHNKAMFQDFSTTEFRPNRIASENPKYIFASCHVNQLVKRPDLALIETPGAIAYEPNTDVDPFKKIINKYVDPIAGDSFNATYFGILRYLWYFWSKNNDLRQAITTTATALGFAPTDYAVAVFEKWAMNLIPYYSLAFTSTYSTETVMDFRAIVIPLTSTLSTYGPWYATYPQAKGKVGVTVDQSLVPWNFVRPPSGTAYDANLNAAGSGILQATISDLEYIDTANITTAGFPEFGPADALGYNSNLTGVSVEFGIGGVRTTYNLQTYGAKPGTFRKSEFDDLTKGKFDPRAQLEQPVNNNLIYTIFTKSNRDIFTD